MNIKEIIKFIKENAKPLGIYKEYTERQRWYSIKKKKLLYTNTKGNTFVKISGR